MNRVERLIKQYEHAVALPWEKTLAGPQRVWFAVYDKTDERRIRANMSEFEVFTRRAAHGWSMVDLTDAFGHWMSEQAYRESYFESPEDLKVLLPQFEAHVVRLITDRLMAPEVDQETVVAIMGIACLFGFTRVSKLVQDVAMSVRGRLLVLFPGVHEGNNYRLLDARDGWNYLAVPLAVTEGAE